MSSSGWLLTTGLKVVVVLWRVLGLFLKLLDNLFDLRGAVLILARENALVRVGRTWGNSCEVAVGEAGNFVEVV